MDAVNWKEAFRDRLTRYPSRISRFTYIPVDIVWDHLIQEVVFGEGNFYIRNTGGLHKINLDGTVTSVWGGGWFGHTSSRNIDRRYVFSGMNYLDLKAGEILSSEKIDQKRCHQDLCNNSWSVIDTYPVPGSSFKRVQDIQSRTTGEILKAVPVDGYFWRDVLYSRILDPRIARGTEVFVWGMHLVTTKSGGVWCRVLDETTTRDKRESGKLAKMGFFRVPFDSGYKLEGVVWRGGRTVFLVRKDHKLFLAH